MKKKSQVTFTVDSELKKRMQVYGKRYRINWSAMVESALAPFVNSIHEAESQLPPNTSEQDRLIKVMGYVHVLLLGKLEEGKKTATKHEKKYGSALDVGEKHGSTAKHPGMRQNRKGGE